MLQFGEFSLNVKDLSSKLGEMFQIKNFENIDKGLNGLQVGNLDAKVRKVAFAVDAKYDDFKRS